MTEAYSLTVSSQCAEPSIEDRLVWLMDTYERRVYTFLLMLVRIPALAEDCTQDTFLRAYENLRKAKTVSRGWLFKVARNRAMDVLRDRAGAGSGQEDVERVAAPITCDDNQEVWEAMARLPHTDREVLYLFAVAGFKTDEIGAILHIQGSAVRQRLYRARQRFRTVYEPWCPRD